MANLRQRAQHHRCQIRLIGCLGQPTCLCHWRQIGISGMGMKSPDWFGAIGCDACHKKVDSTMRGDVETQLDFARGVFRTQAIWLSEGIAP